MILVSNTKDRKLEHEAVADIAMQFCVSRFAVTRIRKHSKGISDGYELLQSLKPKTLLGFFDAVQSVQQDVESSSISQLIDVIHEAFDCIPHRS